MLRLRTLIPLALTAIALSFDSAWSRGGSDVIDQALERAFPGCAIERVVCRLGDPETEPLLMRLSSDLVPLLIATCDEKLEEQQAPKWDPRPCVTVVACSGGYPGDYKKGVPICGLDRVKSGPDLQVFHAGTAKKGGDVVTGALDPADHTDLGPKRTVLSPDPGKVRVRWFAINPRPPGVPDDVMNAMVRERFASFDADHHLTDQTKHPAMHKTASLDVICLLQGEVDLILDKARTRVKPGQIVIQRGTSHGWEAIGGPALLLAVLIDRPLVSGEH